MDPIPPEYVGTTTRSPVSNSTSAFLGRPLERASTSTTRFRHLGSVSLEPTKIRSTTPSLG